MTQICTPVLGIEYAKSVTGTQRWQPSVVQTIFSTNSKTPGLIAPQIPSLNPLVKSKDVDLKQNEDCLSLNVFTPQNAEAWPQKALPVMVWIHGGGFQIGTGALPEYDGAKLAQAGNVVVVSINYRLGCLGFLRLCDISEGAIAATGNEGLHDQITALKWIQAHIHLFGGDNANVTLFGESAGAMSIACLLASPQANTLFHKAILQSGAGHAYSSVDKANSLAAEFVKYAMQLGYSLPDFATMDIAGLMKIQAFFLAQPEIYKKFGILPFTPVIDGELLPEPPHLAIANGAAKEIIIMAGTNTDEWAFFAVMLGQKIETEAKLKSCLAPLLAAPQGTPKTIQHIDTLIDWAQRHISQRGRTPTYQQIINEIFTEFWFAEPCHRLLKAQINAGGKAYGYLLGRRSPIEKFGCTHVADVGFVFDTTSKVFHGNGPRVKILVNTIQTSWCHFAYHGTPASSKLKWPTYADQFTYQFFDHNKTHLVKRDLASVDIWSEVSDQQLAAF